MYRPHFDEARFRDLMLYLAHRCQDADYLGSTKLCKLLYYSDFTAFARTGSPITGRITFDSRLGPMPREFYRQRRRLIEAGLARMEMRAVFDRDRERLVPLVDAEYFVHRFCGPEREAVDRTLETLAGMITSEAAEYSHGEVGFLIAADGETIPYEAAYLVSERDDELNRVIDRAFAAWVRSRDVE